MKKLIYILLLSMQAVFAQSAFDEGNAFYRQEKYEKAAASYENVLKSGKESAELYFNLGNAYYKMHKVAPAIYNYEKALLLHPGDNDITVNLRFAQKMAIDDIKEVPEVGFSKMLHDFTGSYHYDTWAWIAVGSAVAFLLFFIGYYLGGTTLLKRVFFVGMSFSLLAVIISVLAAFFLRSEYTKDRPAIVFAEVAPVKSEPRESGADAFVLHEGTKVFVIETLDNWEKIRLEDDSQGWIAKTAIKELKETGQ